MAEDIQSSEPTDRYRRQMRLGVLWLAVGTIVTAGTYVLAGNGGTYVVAWGAIIVGAIDIIRGYVGLLRHRDSSRQLSYAVTATCPHCSQNAELDEEEQANRSFVCPACNRLVQLDAGTNTVAQSTPVPVSMEGIPDIEPARSRFHGIKGVAAILVLFVVAAVAYQYFRPHGFSSWTAFAEQRDEKKSEYIRQTLRDAGITDVPKCIVDYELVLLREDVVQAALVRAMPDQKFSKMLDEGVVLLYYAFSSPVYATAPEEKKEDVARYFAALYYDDSMVSEGKFRMEMQMLLGDGPASLGFPFGELQAGDTTVLEDPELSITVQAVMIHLTAWLNPRYTVYDFQQLSKENQAMVMSMVGLADRMIAGDRNAWTWWAGKADRLERTWVAHSDAYMRSPVVTDLSDAAPFAEASKGLWKMLARDVEG